MSWVGEFSLAQKQACLWLEETSNKEDLNQHTDVGRVVLEKVLIPQRKYKEIHCLIGKLDGMSDVEKESILKWIDQMQVVMDQRQHVEKHSETSAHFKKGQLDKDLVIFVNSGMLTVLILNCHQPLYVVLLLKTVMSVMGNCWLREGKIQFILILEPFVILFSLWKQIEMDIGYQVCASFLHSSSNCLFLYL